MTEMMANRVAGRVVLRAPPLHDRRVPDRSGNHGEPLSGLVAPAGFVPPGTGRILLKV